MALTCNSMKAKDKITAVILSFLLFLLGGLSVLANREESAAVTVKNQKEILYSKEPPPLPEAKAGSININTASAALLMTLPQIGPALSERIISHREENGPFPHPACIMEVSGIGEKTYEKIKDKIKVRE